MFAATEFTATGLSFPSFNILHILVLKESMGCAPPPLPVHSPLRAVACSVRSFRVHCALVPKKLIDMPRAVAYIRYHIVFRACLRACGSLRVLRVLWKHPGKTA